MSKSALFSFVQQVACEEPFVTALCWRNLWGLRCRQGEGGNVWDRSKYGRHNIEGSSKGLSGKQRGGGGGCKGVTAGLIVKRLPPQLCWWGKIKVWQENQQTTRFLCWLDLTWLVDTSLIRTVLPVFRQQQMSEGSTEDEWRSFLTCSSISLVSWNQTFVHIWMGKGLTNTVGLTKISASTGLLGIVHLEPFWRSPIVSMTDLNSPFHPVLQTGCAAGTAHNWSEVKDAGAGL